MPGSNEQYHTAKGCVLISTALQALCVVGIATSIIELGCHIVFGYLIVYSVAIVDSATIVFASLLLLLFEVSGF